MRNKIGRRIISIALSLAILSFVPIPRLYADRKNTVKQTDSAAEQEQTASPVDTASLQAEYAKEEGYLDKMKRIAENGIIF